MDARDALGEPTATVSRSALLHNAAVVRRAVGRGVKVCATIKANAYGHGAALVADTLANFSTNDFGTPSVDAFAVADLDEAAALPDTPLPVLVLRPVENCFVGRQRARVEEAVRAGWWLTVATPTAVDDIARIAAATGKRAHLHVLVDTGMSRGGVAADDLDGLLDRIEHRPASLRLAGLFTHFANGEDPDSPLTVEQLATFLDRTDGPAERSNGRLLRHAAASGATFFTPPAHLDLVRPGLALYGIDPSGRPTIDRPLKPALRWTAPLIGIRDVPAGGTVGVRPDLDRTPAHPRRPAPRRLRRRLPPGLRQPRRHPGPRLHRPGRRPGEHGPDHDRPVAGARGRRRRRGAAAGQRPGVAVQRVQVGRVVRHDPVRGAVPHRSAGAAGGRRPRRRPRARGRRVR